MENLSKLVLEKLESLGKQSRSIAKTLISLEIKGKKKDGHYCPLAEYLKKEIPEISLALIDVDKAYFQTVKKHQFDVELPNVIKKFVKDFDNQLYEELYI